MKLTLDTGKKFLQNDIKTYEKIKTNFYYLHEKLKLIKLQEEESLVFSLETA